MTTAQVEAGLLRQYGVRAEPAMRDYVIERVAANAGGFPILAGDARTGLPVRQIVLPSEMTGAEVGA